MKNTTAEAVFINTRDLVVSLYSRWQDEKEYEDIADYASVLTKAISPHGATLTKMTKKPFGFHFLAEGKKYFFGVNSRRVYYKP
jgi:hypothetical protein